MIDLTRSRGIFNPDKFKLPVHVIGAGATGSHVVNGLIQQGVRGQQIHVYDFDHVEEHNINNQLYTLPHVGMPKVEALRKIILENYEEEINIHLQKVESVKGFEGVIFLLVDSSRKEIYQSFRMNPKIKLVIETGLDARFARFVTLNPISSRHMKFFEENYLFEDDDAEYGETSACGSRQVIHNTVTILSGMAVWELMKWVNNPSNIGFDYSVCTDPWDIMVRDINK